MKIEEYVKYDPESGIFTWIRKPNRNIVLGSEAGHREKTGYIRIRFNKKCIQAGRLAFYLMTGEWPTGVIDHEDRNPSNNKWINLRDVTQQVNTLNKFAKGYYRTPYNKFLVQVRYKGEMFYQNNFDDEELAELVAQEAQDIRNRRNGFQLKV